jgi:hypothetical protein
MGRFTRGRTEGDSYDLVPTAVAKHITNRRNLKITARGKRKFFSDALPIISLRSLPLPSLLLHPAPFRHRTKIKLCPWACSSFLASSIYLAQDQTFTCSLAETLLKSPSLIPFSNSVLLYHTSPPMKTSGRAFGLIYISQR